MSSEAKTKVILLVDDTVLVRGFAKRLLEEAAYQVLEADDAPGALKLAADAAQRIDLLITDLLLPGPSGLELARRLRRTRPALKVILVSADPGNGAAATRIPDARFLEKTQMIEELAPMVAEFLEE